jgi:hypothetical protein
MPFHVFEDEASSILSSISGFIALPRHPEELATLALDATVSDIIARMGRTVARAGRCLATGKEGFGWLAQ